MNSRRVRGMRLLTAISVLGLAGSVLALVATPVSASPSASAARAARHLNPVVPSSGHGSRPAHLAGSAIPHVSTSSPFQIFNWNSGLCLGIYQGQHDAPALQWGCNGNPDQTWQYDYATLQLTDSNSGMCLDAQGGLGAQAVQEPARASRTSRGPTPAPGSS